MGRSGEVAARVDAVQRGRSAMDEMTRQLRSQVCLQNAGIAAMVQPRSIEVGHRGLGDVLRRHARHER